MNEFDLKGDYTVGGYKHIRRIATDEYAKVTVDLDRLTGKYYVTTKHNGFDPHSYLRVGSEFDTEEEAFAFAVALVRFI